MATLHLICGMAGSRKTTLALRLQADVQVMRMCPDEWIRSWVSDTAHQGI